MCHASQYGIGNGYHGRRTASGERFNTYAVTAAHRTKGLRPPRDGDEHGERPVGCGRINDRRPFVRGRCIDLSRAAANAIEMGGRYGAARVDNNVLRLGLAQVRCLPIGRLTCWPFWEWRLGLSTQPLAT